MGITTKDWNRAIHHFNAIKSRYISLFDNESDNLTSIDIRFALEFVFPNLEKRYNSNERTEELYKELLAVE